MPKPLEGLSDEELRTVKTPSKFVQHVLDKDPYRYQREFLDADPRQKVFVAGRQVGKSTSLAWYGVWRFIQPDTDVLYFAPSQRQAVELFHTKLKGEIDGWLDDPDAYGITYESKTEIRGSNGSRLKAMTAAGSGETIRTYTADCIIVDEAAFIEDEFFTSVLMPMLLTTGGDFILAGTPWGQEGFFYNKFSDDSDRWFTTQVSSYENPDIPSERVEEWKKDMTASEFKREVLGEFVPGTDAAFPAEDVKACIFRDDETLNEFPLYDGPPCYLGVDPARHGDDQAVFVSLDGNGNVFDVKTEANCKLSQVEGIIRNLNDRRGYESILIDETGLGGGPLDNLKEDYKHVEGFTFSLESKQELYQMLISTFEDHGITIPDKRWMRNEIMNIQYDTTPTGRHKYEPRGDGSDDFVDALALAVWAWEGQSTVERAPRVFTFG